MQNTVGILGEQLDILSEPRMNAEILNRTPQSTAGLTQFSCRSIPATRHNPHFALWTEMREKNQVGPAVRSGTCRGAGSTACGRRAGCVGRRVCTGRCVSPPLQQERSKSPSQLRPMSRALVVCALASLASADAARFNCTHSYEVRAHTRRHCLFMVAPASTLIRVPAPAGGVRGGPPAVVEQESDLRRVCPQGRQGDPCP